MKHKAELIIDTIVFEAEKEEDSFRHSDILNCMYEEDFHIMFSAETLIEAVKNASRFASENDTNGLIMCYEDDKYEYSMMIFSNERCVGNMIITKIDGEDAEVWLNDFDFDNLNRNNIEEEINKEVESWAK